MSTAQSTDKPSPPKVSPKPIEKQEVKVINSFRIRDTVANYNWTVVGLDDCSYTKEAIELLAEHKENYKYIPLNAEWQRRLVVEFNTRRVPVVFTGSRYFGGLADLKNYYQGSFIADTERF